MSVRTHASFIDGPLAGKSIATDRAPIMLRVAFNSAQGRCLNNEDAPLHTEKAYAYIMAGPALHGFWDGRDPNTGRRTGGTMMMAAYRLLDPQPPREILDGAGAWGAWCDENKTDLLARFERSKAKGSGAPTP